MVPPNYQEVPASKIPVARTPDGRVTVRVIAGEALGARAVIDTRTPILYLHFTLEPGARIEQAIPSGYNAFAYVVEGEGLFGANEQAVAKGRMTIFDQSGAVVSIQATAPLSVLLIAGQPLNEPVARYGPFVMNTQQEIRQAMEDYQAGRMGVITR